MSYILDALKKAEAERNPDTRASLALGEAERRRHRTLLYVVIAALLANAVVLLWLFLPESDQGPAAVTPGAERAASPSASTTERVASPGPSTTGPSPTGDRVPEIMPATGPLPAAPAPTPTPVRTTLAALPAADRARFPALAFSTHVYADDPTLRAVVVNGTRLKEGDRLESLEVAEITESGAVFAFGNYLVSVPVLEGWN